MTGLDVLVKLKAKSSTQGRCADDAQRAERATQASSPEPGVPVEESAGEDWSTPFISAAGARLPTAAVTRSVMRRMADSAGQAPSSELTPRQVEVLRLIVKGQRMKEIASTLRLSTRTVETHKYK